MRHDVVRFLRCPVCHEPLAAPEVVGGALCCPRRHSFDQARQGYAQLTAGPLVHTGDTARMVEARTAFLAAGHYDTITAVLARQAVATWPGDGLVLDVGAGTGHHLAGVLDRLPHAAGLAIDASRPAIRRAARAHPRMSAAICDAWQPLPIGDDAVGVLVNVFAPRSGREFARVLRPDGVLLLVTPTTAHLDELIGPLGLLRVDPAKADRVADGLGDALRRTERGEHVWSMALRHDEVTTLVGMGPSAWHTDPVVLAGRVAALPDPVTVTASVTLGTYRLR